jgi:isohexenylglutaconyl-CoA hydratase
MPETSRGLPPAQIAPFVVQRIGQTQARKLVLTSAQFNGHEALRLGLVHELFADEVSLRESLARNIEHVLRCAPQANACSKAIVLSAEKSDQNQLLDKAASDFARCARGIEAPEGIAAFMKKRDAAWVKKISDQDVVRLLTLACQEATV